MMARLMLCCLLLCGIACPAQLRAQIFSSMPQPPTRPEGTPKDQAQPLARAVQYAHPRFSPDGKRIAFLRGMAADAATEIRVMNRDGTRSTRIVTVEEVRKAATRVYHKYTDASEAPPLELEKVTTFNYLEWLPSSDRLICGAATSLADQYLFYAARQAHLHRYSIAQF